VNWNFDEISYDQNTMQVISSVAQTEPCGLKYQCNTTDKWLYIGFYL